MAKKRRRGPIKTKTPETNTKAKTQKPDFAKFKKFYIYILLVVLAGIPFITGKYIEINSPGPFDSGSYVYSAQHIASGAKLYVDEMPSAQPATLLINFIGVKIFGFSETGPIIMQAILQLAAFAMMFLAVRKMCGSGAAVISVVIASIYLSCPLIAKFGNVKEQFMVSFMVITASSFILRQMAGKWWWLLVTGAAAINIYYFKQTGASVLVAIMLYLILSIALAPKKWRSVVNDFLLILAGACIGILPLFTFYIWQGLPAHFLKTLPAYTLLSLLKLSIFAVVIYIVIRLARQLHILTHLKKLRQVRRVIWISGAIAIPIALLLCVYFFNSYAIVDLQFKPVANPGYMKYYNPDQVAAELEEIEAVGYMEYYKSFSKRATQKDIPIKRGGELDSYISSIAFIKYPAKLIGYPVSITKGIAGKFGHILSKVTGSDGYLSRKNLDLKTQSEKVLRFYKALKLPISMAVLSIVAGVAVLVLRVSGVRKQTTTPDRLVVFIAVWWILDMTFLWISPRSYEQYYLPLVGSAAVLGGYICSFFFAKLDTVKFKLPWQAGGAFIVLMMAVMAWPIYAGQVYSPHHGGKYPKDHPSRKGYVQALNTVKERKTGSIGAWEVIGEYIKERTTEQDRIYVWGWYPGIYVEAQRLSSAKKAFESEMHVKSPEVLEKEIAKLIRTFKKNPPKFIVDSKKSHFPWNRPPLELWPTKYDREGLIPNKQAYVGMYERGYSKLLAEKIDPDEAARFKAMSAFRQFVMGNYEIVEPKNYYKASYKPPKPPKCLHKRFGSHRVFRLKKQ